MPCNVAPNDSNTVNTLQPIPISLCRLTFDPPPRETRNEAKDQNDQSGSPKDESKTIFDTYLDGTHVGPLKQAYVILITAAETETATDASIILCRTNDDGELVIIEEGEIDSSVPDITPSNRMQFVPDATVLYHWTLSPKRFRKVVNETKSDYAKAARIHDFACFCVRGQDLTDDDRDFPFVLLEERSSWSSPVYATLDHVLLMSPSTEAAPGYFDGDRLSDLFWSRQVFEGMHSSLNYVFARRRVADAVYCGELAQAHALALQQRSAKEFAIFSQARDISARARGHDRAPQLDKMAEHQLHRVEYDQYAYDCAMDSRVERRLYSQAVTVAVITDDWMYAAKQIAEDYGITSHPCMDLNSDPPEWQYSFIDYGVAMRYFDFYRFGIQTQVIQAVQFSGASEIAIQRQLEAIRDRIAQLLRTLHYYDVALCLGNYPDDAALDKNIHQRYLDLSLDVYHRWYDTFDPEEKSSWQKLKPYLDDAGTFAEKTFGTYSEHFDAYENIEKYNKLLEGQKDRAQSLIKKMVRWNERTSGKTIQFKDPSQEIALSVDLENGILTMKQGSKEITTFHFLMEELPRGEQRVAQKFVSRSGRVRWRKVKVPSKYAGYKLEPQLKEPNNWPAWLGVFGKVLSLSISIAEMFETIESDDATSGERVVAVARVARDTFEIVDSLSAALHATFSYGQEEGMFVKFAEVGEKFKGPGLVLEAILNIHEGATILMLGEDSLSAAAVSRGDNVEGWLQESRGLILVSSAVPGAVAAGSSLLAGETAAGALGAALPPLGLALAVGAVVVIGIGVYINWRHGGSNFMDPLLDALDKATAKEFGRTFDEERTLQSLKDFSKTVDHLVAQNMVTSSW